MNTYTFIVITFLISLLNFDVKAQSENCNAFFVDELLEQKIDTLTIQCNLHFERNKKQEIVQLFMSQNGDIIARVSIISDNDSLEKFERKITHPQLEKFRQLESMLDTGNLTSNEIGVSGASGEYFFETYRKTKSYHYKNLFSIVKSLNL